jgi:hypothetical protein
MYIMFFILLFIFNNIQPNNVKSIYNNGMDYRYNHTDITNIENISTNFHKQQLLNNLENNNISNEKKLELLKTYDYLHELFFLIL